MIELSHKSVFIAIKFDVNEGVGGSGSLKPNLLKYKEIKKTKMTKFRISA